MERRSSMGVMGSLAGAAAALLGFGGEMQSAAEAAANSVRLLRGMRAASPSHHRRMTRRSTLHHSVRNYRYDPFTPAPMAAQYKGEPTRQVTRQHLRRFNKVVEARLKREARRA